jgi:protein ImuB
LTGGIALLRLIPDQLVRATGRQLGLWGDAVVSDRVARAALRVQALLGHTAVTRPVLAGGRSAAEQALLVPFGDAEIPRLPTDRPWPGRIPPPSPATVYQDPWPVQITDGSGTPVTVTGRAQISGAPVRLATHDGPPLAVVSWAGPWPVTERWWDPPRARRQARFQFVTEDGSAWQAVVRGGRWLIEASYDLIWRAAVPCLPRSRACRGPMPAAVPRVPHAGFGSLPLSVAGNLSDSGSKLWAVCQRLAIQ